MNGWEAETLARCTAADDGQMRKCIAVLPSPKRVAESLREASLLALIAAPRNRHGEHLLRQPDRGTIPARELIEAGVVEVGGVFVSTFGMAVRREALTMRALGELG